MAAGGREATKCCFNLSTKIRFSLKSKVTLPIPVGMATTPAKKKHKPNPQRHPRAASFIRVGKGLKVRATNYRKLGQTERADWLTDVASEMQHEGKYLRSLG